MEYLCGFYGSGQRFFLFDRVRERSCLILVCSVVVRERTRGLGFRRAGKRYFVFFSMTRLI
jgi:hypothetical protein